MSLPWARLILKGIEKRRFHTSTSLSIFYESPDKDGYRIKSDEEKKWEKLSFREKIRLELELFKEGLKEWATSMKNGFITGPRLFIKENEVDIVARFTDNQEELKKWVVSTDKDHNVGYSTAKLELTRDLKGIFYGHLDTKLPDDGRIKTAGFCNLRLIPRLDCWKSRNPYNWSLYTHIVFRLRGDGRVYGINLHKSQSMDVTMYDTYHYFIWTRGGPYWQYVKIPFSKFVFAYKGRIQSRDHITPTKDLDSISFTLADKISGPFQLEIDYIGVLYDPSHIEETAYENYKFEQRFV